MGSSSDIYIYRSRQYKSLLIPCCMNKRMAKKKKRHLNCALCGAEANFYKKGKGHRVLVCNNGHLLATNPIPLLAALAPAIKTAVVSGGAALVGSKIGQAFSKATDKEEEPKSVDITIDNKDIPNRLKADQWYINQALRGRG